MIIPVNLAENMLIEDLLNQTKLIKTNSVFWHPYRFTIFILLNKYKRLSFAQLKKGLKVSDGNLASHMRVIEKSGFIITNKGFEGRYPKTVYTLSPTGKHQLKKFAYLLSLHLSDNALERTS